MRLVDKLMRTDGPAAVVVIRLHVGGVDLSERVQTFLYAGLRGSGRFAGLGIPPPEFFGPFVGAVEIVCPPGDLAR